MNRRVILLAAAAAVLVLLGWYFLLWTPTKGDLDEAKEARETAEQRDQQLRSQIDRLRDVQRSEPLRRAQLETLRTAIPDTPNLGQFIIDVNDAATRAGIRFISIAPGEPRAPARATPAATAGDEAGGTTTTTAGGGTGTGTAAATPPAEISLNFQVSGGYYPVIDFLNRLDRLPRLVVVDSINVSGTGGGNAALTVTLTARMFVRSVPPGFAGASPTTSSTAPGGSTTTTVAGGAGATTTTAAGGAGATTTTTGARP